MDKRRALTLFCLALFLSGLAAAAPVEKETSQILSIRELPGGAALLTVRTAPGRTVSGPLLDAPPPPPPGALEEEEEGARFQLSAPVRDDGIDIFSPQTVETGPGGFDVPQAPGTEIVYRNSVLAPPASFSSTVNEPNVGSQGDGLFTTHNWYSAVSTNNGASFSYVSPFTLFPNTPAAFGAGFCCDQRVTQDPSRDLIVWFLQYIKTGSTASSTNGDRIAVTHGQGGLASNTWTYYDLTPEMFGLSGKWFDFPHMQVSANYLYFTTNIFTTTTNAFYGALVGRILLSQLDAGGAATIDSFLTTAFGSVMAVNGAGAEGTRPGRTTMYFASLVTTTSMDVLTWPEANPAPTVTLVSGLATTSLSTYVCVGPDGRDPCTRANVRMQSGWITNTELGVMWTSSQNGGSRPYPYTRIAILDPTTLAVTSQPDIWNSQYAWLYPAVALNERSHLGGTIDALGGTLFPTIRALMRDDLSPDVVTSGWETIDVSASTHGTSGTWGDYNGTVTHEKYPTTWLGVGHAQNGGSTNSSSQPHNFWFMRERDAPHWGLTVSRAGTGSGTVTSVPAGINCGIDCSESILEGTMVTLTATPNVDSTFTGWSGACSGAGTCIVTMSAARSVTATFDLLTPGSGLDFFTVVPCRVIDTRLSTPLASGVAQTFNVSGTCGVPSTAKAVAVNLTAVAPLGTGRITLYPGDGSVPATSTVNFAGGGNPGNNAILSLASNGDGTLAALAVLAAGGTVDMIVDISGYFE